MHTFLIFNKYFLPADPVHSFSSGNARCERVATNTQNHRTAGLDGLIAKSTPAAVFVNLDETTDHHQILQIARDIYL